MWYRSLKAPGKLAEPNGTPYCRRALGGDEAARAQVSRERANRRKTSQHPAKSGAFEKKRGELRLKASLKKRASI